MALHRWLVVFGKTGVTGKIKRAVSDRLTRFRNSPLNLLAEWTGLEPATPGVTGRYSNQLNYHSSTTLLHILGVPTGIRTPVPTVKGLCPRPLDDGDPD